MNDPNYTRTSTEVAQKIVMAIGMVTIEEILSYIVVNTGQYLQIKRGEVVKWARRNHKHYGVEERELRCYLFEQVYDRAERELKKNLLQEQCQDNK